MDAQLRSLGIFAKKQWLQQSVQEYNRSRPRPPAALPQWLLAKFLVDDIRKSADPARSPLPPGVQQLHKKVLSGSMVVQIDDCQDIATAAFKATVDPASGEEKDEQVPQRSRRMYKLLLTDGSQQFCAFEYERVESLDNVSREAIKGGKILIRDSLVRNGLLMLTKNNSVFLGAAKATQENCQNGANRIQVQQPRTTTTAPIPDTTAPITAAAMRRQQPGQRQQARAVPAPIQSSRAVAAPAVSNPAGSVEARQSGVSAAPTMKNSVEAEGVIPVSVNHVDMATERFHYLNEVNHGKFLVKAHVYDLLKFGFGKENGCCLAKFKIVITDGRSTRPCVLANKYAELHLLNQSSANFRKLFKNDRPAFMAKLKEVQEKLKHLEGIMELHTKNGGETEIVAVRPAESTSYGRFLLQRLERVTSTALPASSS